jgi:hypothetical protein
MVRIRRFGVVRTSNVVAIHTLAIGLLIWIPVALILAAVGDIPSVDQSGNPITIPASQAIVGLLILVFVWGGLTWIFTAIRALFYNLVAGISGGGIEVELLQPPAPPYAAGPAWGQPPGGYGQPVAPPPAVEPPPVAERPSYDPAPRWDAPAPRDAERREPDR